MTNGNKTMLTSPLAGIIPPVITPLLPNLQVDTESLGRILSFLLNGDVNGIFVLGTTGEGPSLDMKSKCQVIDQANSVVGKRVPVLVNVSSTSIKDIKFLSEYARNAGAEALVLSPPFYGPVEEASLLSWYKQVLKEIKLPVLLYNIPSHTGVEIGIEVVKALAKHPMVIGLKESSGDEGRFIQIKSEVPSDFTLLVGPGILFSRSLEQGGHGGVAGEANLFPRLFSSLFRCHSQQDWRKVDKLEMIVQEMIQQLFGIVKGPQGYLRSLKAALSLRGLCKNVFIPPYFPVDESELDEIGVELSRLENTYSILKIDN